MIEKEALEALVRITRIFQSEGITLWLHYGTLLGAIRDSKFIPHDKDIDLGASSVDPMRVEAAVGVALSSGFYERDRTNANDLIRLGFGEIDVDLCFFRRRRGVLRAYFTCSSHVIKARHLKGLERATISGREFWVPTRPHELLVDLYGENWGTPDEAKRGGSSSWLARSRLVRPNWWKRPAKRLVDRLFMLVTKKT